MIVTKPSLTAFTAAFVFCAIAIPVAVAQSYPTRPVTMIVPFPPGGGIDVLCRVIAEKLRSALGQNFVVENRAGGNGNIAAEHVAKARPDGHTLLCAPDPVFISHLLHPSLTFDPQAFEPVSVVAHLQMALVSRADLPVGSFGELTQHARAHPGKLTYASQGQGHFGHLMMEALKLRAGLDILHVPYKGATPAINDMLGGRVDLYVGSLASTIGQINEGKIKLIGPTGHTRLARFPAFLALPEAVPGLAGESWLAIAAPPGSPREIPGKLSAAVVDAVRSPDLRARFSELQSVPAGTSPEQMRDMIQRATEQWRQVITAAKISVD